jgi:DNA-binding transcriptional ArsR family regulator
MVNDVEQLDARFGALAHPIRREIVERLAAGPATVGEATGSFAVSKPAISRHLRVLEEAGVVARSREGRTHRLRLRGDALQPVSAWMERQRTLWERKFDVVEDYLREQP